LVDRARRKKVRDRAEDEWMRRFREADESEGRKLEETFLLRHRKRILEVALPRVWEKVSTKAWACFEGRLGERRAAAEGPPELGGEVGMGSDGVEGGGSRVLEEVRRRCAEIEGEPGDDCDLDLSR